MDNPKDTSATPPVPNPKRGWDLKSEKDMQELLDMYRAAQRVPASGAGVKV
jgi:hypothetical protein